MAAPSVRDAFLKDGFVHVRNALDRQTVETALACWTWSTENPGPGSARVFRDSLAHVDDPAAARLLPSAEDGLFYQDISNPDSYPVYEPLINSPAIVRLLTRLLDCERAWFLGEQVFLKEGNTPGTGWHQDISDVSARGNDLIALWIAFDAVDEETSLALVRGSHKGPVYSSIYGRFEAAPIPNMDALPDEFEVVSYACDPGDVVVFHMGCLHGGGPTRPGQSRRTLALRFIGEQCYFESRSDPRDPRNGEPFGRARLPQVLPGRCL